MLKFRNALGAKSPTVKGDFLKSGTYNLEFSVI